MRRNVFESCFRKIRAIFRAKLSRAIVIAYRKPWIIRTPYDACPTVKLLRTVL